MTRRLAVETNVPLITDVKLAKLLFEALYRHYGGRKPRSQALLRGPLLPTRSPHKACTSSEARPRLPLRYITANRILYLPGLIDIHVHTR